MIEILGKLVETATFGKIQAVGGISDLQSPTGWLMDAVNAGSKTATGETITATSVLMFPAYLAAIKNISEDIGKLNLKVYKRLEGGGKEELPKHPLTKVLGLRTAPDVRAMDHKQTTVHHALNGGNAYAEIVRDGQGKPRELHLIHPSRVTPFYKTDDMGFPQLFYKVRGSVTDKHGKKFEAVSFPAKDILHTAGLGSDGLMGYSIYNLVAQSLSIGMAAETFSASFYGNGTTLTGVLESTGALTQEAYKRMRQSWRKLHRGAKRANGLAILESGTSFKPISTDPHKSQLLEARKFQVVEVARILRIPPHKIASMESATFGNIESQNIEYFSDTLGPWMKRIEQEYSFKLFGEDSGIFCEFETNALTLGDTATRTTGYKTMFASGAMTPNQIRDAEGLNKSSEAGMDDYYLQGNLTTVEKIANGENNMVKPNAGSPGTQPKAIAEPVKMSVEDDQEAKLAQFAVESQALLDLYDAHAEAHTPLFKAAADRICTKEYKAIEGNVKTKSGDRPAFEKWAVAFFDKQKADIVTSFSPVCLVFCNTFPNKEFSIDFEFLGTFADNYANSCVAKALSIFDKGQNFSWSDTDSETLSSAIIKEIGASVKGNK